MSFDQSDIRQTDPDGDTSNVFPCTLLQQRLWTQQKTRGPQGLNIAMRWRVDGALSHATAEAALQSVFRRHEALHTCFRETADGLQQIVRPDSILRIHDVDLSALSAEDGTARADAIAQAEAVAPIDPAVAPLARASWLRLGPDRAILLLTLHSMVADGWSTGLIVREFGTAAEAIDSGEAPGLDAPELQFPDYALWEKELLASSALDEARAYWMHRLRDARPTEVPADARPDEDSPAGRGGARSHIVSLLLHADLARDIEECARRQNATLYSLAVAALSLVLQRVTGESEIVIGSQVANREEQVAETLVGPTVNSITLCLPVDDTVSLRSFVGAVADTVNEALRHERLPFEIAEAFALHRAGRPLHAVNLVVHRSYSGTTETEQPGAGRFTLVSLPSVSSGTQWPLNFYMIGRDEGWRLSCEVDADLYRAGTARGLLDAWRTCFEVLATAADQRLADCAALRTILPRATSVHAATDVLLSPAEPIPVHDPQRQVMRFHEGGSLTPVVVLNNRSVYYQLARHLGEDRPFTDILLYHQDKELDLSACAFEDFAAYAVRLIRWAQPRGPYILGGHCVYGVLAFEAAHQLRRLGETVELVTLFDSWAPGYRETMPRWDRLLRKKQLDLAHYGDRLQQYRRGEVGLMAMVSRPILFRLGLLPASEGHAAPPLPGEWFDAYLYEAVARFRSSPYDGDVILFRSNEPLRGRLFDERMGWGSLVTGKLTKVDIDSGHFDMFRERPASEIAAVVRAR